MWLYRMSRAWLQPVHRLGTPSLALVFAPIPSLRDVRCSVATARRGRVVRASRRVPAVVRGGGD